MYSNSYSTCRRGLASLLFVAALLSAFAVDTAAPSPKAPEAPNTLQATVDNLTEQVNNGNKVLPLLQQQRNALAAQVQDYQVQLTIAQNTGTELQKQLTELKTKHAELEAKYDMEKAKVEALLKASPSGSGVRAVQNTPPPVPGSVQPAAQKQ